MHHVTGRQLTDPRPMTLVAQDTRARTPLPAGAPVVARPVEQP
ncbi:hypothetical protein OG871_29425 [Kitasatospora sp. NBC_00374]